MFQTILDIFPIGLKKSSFLNLSPHSEAINPHVKKERLALSEVEGTEVEGSLTTAFCHLPLFIRRLLATTLALLLFTWGWIPEIAIALQKSPTSIQPYLQRVINQLTEFRLDNGLKFIVLERHQAPVVSFLTYADVGGIDEPDGQTGIAHFLEHLAFKGTRRIGTTNYKAEAPLLDKLEQLDNQIRSAKKKW